MIDIIIIISVPVIIITIIIVIRITNTTIHFLFLLAFLLPGSLRRKPWPTAKYDSTRTRKFLESFPATHFRRARLAGLLNHEIRFQQAPNSFLSETFLI